MIPEISKFIILSKYAGERFDLIQAGGGNSSVKTTNNIMLIKASGISLSELDNNHGYVEVDYQKMNKVFQDTDIINETDKKRKENLAKNYVLTSQLSQNGKASIEVFLHSLLGKYVLHTHPLAVNNIVSRSDAKEVLYEIFGNDILFMDYATPGIELGIELDHTLKGGENNHNTKIIFLKNHGLIISSNDIIKIQNSTEEVIEKIEQYLNIDYSNYKLTNKISELINSFTDHTIVSYLSEDKVINELLGRNSTLYNTPPTCPDSFVFNGILPLTLETLDEDHIQKFIDTYGNLPKVIIYDNQVFFVNKTVKKCKEMEEVFKFHLLTIKNANSRKIDFLPKQELKYLGNWEAEKYRQNIKN